jgi:hypothetical protein
LATWLTYFVDRLFDFCPIPGFSTSTLDVQFDLNFAAVSLGSGFRTEAAVGTTGLFGTAVPQPSAAAMLTLGLASVAAVRRWRTRKRSGYAAPYPAEPE